MWLKLPAGGARTFRYTHRTEKMHGMGVVRLKQSGPFTQRRTFTFDDLWANAVKQTIGEDPLPFDYNSFFDVLSGNVAFGWKQKVSTAATGWAGELLGCVAYLQELGVPWTSAYVVRVTQVGGPTKFPDFVVLDPKTMKLHILECKATTRVVTPGPMALDVCACLDERRADGRTKFAGKPIAWYEDENGVRHHVASFPGHLCVVVASTFVDGSYSAGVPVSCTQTSGKTTGCIDTCLRTTASSPSQAAVVYYKNPFKRMTVIPPSEPEAFISLLGDLQRGIWGASPIVYWSAVRGLLSLLEEDSRDVGPGAGLVSYIIRAASEHIRVGPPPDVTQRLARYAQELTEEVARLLTALSSGFSADLGGNDFQSQFVEGDFVESEPGRSVWRIAGQEWRLLSDGTEVRGVSTGTITRADLDALVDEFVQSVQRRGASVFRYNVAGPVLSLESDGSIGDRFAVVQADFGRRLLTLTASEGGRFRLMSEPM